MITVTNKPASRSNRADRKTAAKIRRLAMKNPGQWVNFDFRDLYPAYSRRPLDETVRANIYSFLSRVRSGAYGPLTPGRYEAQADGYDISIRLEKPMNGVKNE